MLLKKNKTEPVIPAIIKDHSLPWTIHAIMNNISKTHVISTCSCEAVKVAKKAKYIIKKYLILCLISFISRQTEIIITKTKIAAYIVFTANS